MNDREIRVLDLFSGIGGFSLGLKRAGGFRTVAYCEIESYCQAVLLARMRDGWLDTAPIHSDITKLDGKPWRGRVDLICGGFPCQPFSSASRGRRRGKEDHRWLWPEMYRLVEIIRPSWVLAENVPDIERAGLESVVSDLEASDYQVAPPLEIPACAFGFDHRRSRLWILGYTNSYSESIMPINGEVARVQRCGSDTGAMGTSDGIPRRMDRLSAIGNSVVPQIVEWIGRRIREAFIATDREDR